jgi:hypothetical protein
MEYFYALKRQKDKNWHIIDKESVKDVKEYIKASIIVGNLSGKESEYIILTKEELNKIKEDRYEKELKKIKLDRRAINVAFSILEFELDDFSKKNIIQFGLNKEINKPYYVYRHIYDNYKGSFCDEKDLVKLFEDKYNSYSDEDYIEVFRVEDCGRIDVDVQVSVKLWIDGKEIKD